MSIRLNLLRSSSLLIGLGLGLGACVGDDTGDTDSASTSEGETETGTSTTTSTGPTTTSETTTTGEPTTTTGDPTTTSTTTTSTTTTTTTTTTGGLEDDSIYDIQGEIIAVGSDVDVQGVIVTAKAMEGLFVQEPDGGEYSGVWVHVGDMGPDIAGLELGDEVDLIGITDDFNGLTEIDASGGTVMATGNKGLLPAPEAVGLDVLGTPESAEPWEGVLVRVEGMLGVEDEPDFDEFIIGDMTDQLYVDKLMYNVYMNDADFPMFGVGATFTAISGPLHFAFDNFKVEPRMLSDLEGYMPPEKLAIGIDELVPGDLVVTELMWDPSCPSDACEWIEVYNATDEAVDLDGLLIQDENLNPNSQGEIKGELILEAGDYAWLGRNNPDKWPYAEPADAHYGSNPALNNSGDDQVVILNSNEVIDSIGKYLGVPMDTGISWHLKPDQLDAMANDDMGNWCFSTNVFDNPNNIDEYGSPGAENEAECNML